MKFEEYNLATSEEFESDIHIKFESPTDDEHIRNLLINVYANEHKQYKVSKKGLLPVKKDRSWRKKRHLKRLYEPVKAIYITGYRKVAFEIHYNKLK